MHALIVGARGVGKSTLIRRVLKELDRPVFGFETQKETALADEALGSPVYIYEAGREREKSAENLIGYSEKRDPDAMRLAFDRFAPKLRSPHGEDCVIIMDEIGFMESQSEEFCSAVLALLDGDTPVIAAVKDKDTDFLNAVRAHPKGKCFYINENNRDELFTEVSDFLKSQLDAE